ncbi:hypothetical protein PE067_08480 [Paracoccus sp. DMF-8]|uniref:hypothetical protein n=1 Tax=Paracoccus sp. DMF-8 TaxID=3019445 RepID=UPI0023E7DFCA|nr:hypothetical protein [Paracoccus sp. DMF-8]MDF3606161.1 hypothetical protein [Paracoccus sp. DMF-8]
MSGLNQNGASTTQLTARGFVNSGSHGGLLLANPADFRGTRIFVVAQMDTENTANNFAGYAAQDTNAAGGRNNLMWYSVPRRWDTLRWNGTGNDTETVVRGRSSALERGACSHSC